MNDTLQAIFTVGSALVGVPALVTVIINILKGLNIAKDNDATNWNLILNGLGAYAMFAWKVFDPTANIQVADQTINSLVPFIGLLGQVLIMMASSRFLHSIIKGIPIIGKSYSAGN
jgi:hypothetical protein